MSQPSNPPSGVMVLDRGDVVDVVYLNLAAKRAGLPRLLEAAEVDGSQVQLRTGGTDRAFRVTRTVAETVGYVASNEDAEQGTVQVMEPPRTGKGSSRDAWLEYLTSHGIDVPELGATRDQLIALWDERKGLPAHFFEKA